MPVMQMWFWLATDQSLPTAEIFRYQKSEGFVTCFWINPTGSCCWIGPASSWGIPSLSRDARRDRCDGWHAASRQILGVNDTIVLLEPSLPNATKQGWTKIWEIEQAWWKYMCNYVFFFFFEKYRGELRRGEKPSKEVNCGPKQSAFWVTDLRMISDAAMKVGGRNVSPTCPTTPMIYQVPLFCCPFPFIHQATLAMVFGCFWGM